MDESVVQAALLSAEKQILFLYQSTDWPREALDVFQIAKSGLELLQAYMRDYEDQTDESRRWMDPIACTDIANKIQDVLDGLMYKLLLFCNRLSSQKTMNPKLAISWLSRHISGLQNKASNRNLFLHKLVPRFFSTSASPIADDDGGPLKFVKEAHELVSAQIERAVSLSAGYCQVSKSDNALKVVGKLKQLLTIEEAEKLIQELTEEEEELYSCYDKSKEESIQVLIHEEAAVYSDEVNNKPIQESTELIPDLTKAEAVDSEKIKMIQQLKKEASSSEKVKMKLIQMLTDHIEKIKGELNQQLANDSNKGKEKLDEQLTEEDPKVDLSHLPSHLKSCFSYLSRFPEGHSVSRGTLLRLWVAEGFVTPKRGITVEQVAEGYLNELIARNLITVTHGGRGERCHVLHHVRQKVSIHSSFATLIDDSYSSPGVDIIYRLFLVTDCIDVTKDMTSNVRSVVVSRAHSRPSLLQPKFLPNKFLPNKLLKVLDLKDTALTEFPESIAQLYLLKYLSLRNTQIKDVPKTISNLLFLESLDLKYTLVCKLPEEIGQLERLRHLILLGTSGVNGGVDISASALKGLSSIQKLSLLKVANRGILKVIERLIGLRKLGLTDLKKEDGQELCASIQKMQNLSTLAVHSSSEDEYLDLGHMAEAPRYLQHLYLKGRLECFPQWISQLNSLTKFGLEGSKLKDNPVKAIQDLPYLMELDLVDCYTGNMMIFEPGTFPTLVKLTMKRLEELCSIELKVGALPSLHTLVIERCKSLKELPVGIDDLTLAEFHLYDMPDELTTKLEKNGEARPLVKHISTIHIHNVRDFPTSVTEASTSEQRVHIEENDSSPQSKGVSEVRQVPVTKVRRATKVKRMTRVIRWMKVRQMRAWRKIQSRKVTGNRPVTKASRKARLYSLMPPQINMIGGIIR